MINGFHVMAILQTARAKALGFSLDSAKSFGLNRAIFYRAVKFEFKHQIPSVAKRNLSHERSISGQKRQQWEQSYKLKAVGNEKAYSIIDQGKLRFVVDNKIIYPEDYDRAIRDRLGGTYNQAWNEAQKIVGLVGPYTLESPRYFYELVYKSRRDQLVARWNNLSTHFTQQPTPTYGFVYAHQIRRTKKKPS